MAVTSNVTGYRVIKSKCTDVYSLYKYIRSKYKLTSILESLGEPEENTSRYSIIGVIARQKLFGKAESCLLEDLQTGTTKKVNWLSVLDQWTEYNENNAVLTPLQLGAIGYIGYENKYLFENLQKQLVPDHDIPDVFLVRYSTLFIYDRLEKKSYWVIEEKTDAHICSEIEERYSSFEEAPSPFYTLGDVIGDTDEDTYADIIKKTIEYIRSGDIFQANITIRFHGSYSGDPLVLYEYFRKTTPNPFFAYLDFDYPLISTSPERFIKITGRNIYSNPIKGTVRCIIDGKDQKQALQDSLKNRAENVMITDLIRNDLGRVCTQGSIEVKALCAIKKFNSLYHMESIVCGKLKEYTKYSDIMKATFPGGSITGAPKIRSMDIIEELETTVRGPYCGAIGFWGNSGYIDTSIAIRVVYFDKIRYYCNGGGGITIASDPDDEYKELILKLEKLTDSFLHFNILRSSRESLDRIDERLIDIIGERFSVIENISEIKKAYHIPVLQSARVNSILKLREQYIKDHKIELSKEFIEQLYQLLIDYSMKIESKS